MLMVEVARVNRARARIVHEVVIHLSAFLNGWATSVLRFLSARSVKQLYAGEFLHRILESIVQPPSFWNTLVEAHRACTLTDEATSAFAWLLLELLCSRSDQVPNNVREVAERVTCDESFIKSEVQDVRNLGHKIKHVLESTSPDATGDGPGGRHDNDFVDYRKITIMPTRDEFESADKPFFRVASAFESEEPDRRGQVHLDNQFRLLREDLLGELRNDFQIATGAKKGRRKTTINHRRRKHCSIRLLCVADISQLSRFQTQEQRKLYIVENKNFLKHQSLGCLVSDGHIIAFASVDRDVDKLASQPPVLSLRITDEPSLKQVLIASKSSTDLSFVQVDTAVFAYEPILKCLQRMPDVPLQEQLLNTVPDAGEALSGVQPSRICETIREHREDDLQDILETTKSVRLDDAQIDSLLTGISKRVSIIQGPPGKSHIRLHIPITMLQHHLEGSFI